MSIYKKIFLGTGVVLLLAAIWSCQPAQEEMDWNQQITQNWLSEAEQSEVACLSFMTLHMIDTDGGIRTNYKDMPNNIQLATGSEVLSESQGLMMNYALNTDNKMLFDQSLEYVQNSLANNNIIAYRYADDIGAYPVNAVVDDFRIIDALLTAGEVWEQSVYTEFALAYAENIYQTNVFDGRRLVDFYDIEYQSQNDFITLCYIDLNTLNRLKASDNRWRRVIRTMSGIIKNGYISDDFPLYATSYSYTEKFYQLDTINMVEAGLTVLNLARVGECTEITHNFLKQMILNGPVYGRYYPDGSPADTVESTAIYAILAQIAIELNDAEMYRACIDRMLAFQVLDDSSEVYGAFADPDTLDLYAFDNLNALLALEGRPND